MVRLESIRDKETGAWFGGNPDAATIVTGAMKVLTGLQWLNRLTGLYAAIGVCTQAAILDERLWYRELSLCCVSMSGCCAGRIQKG